MKVKNSRTVVLELHPAIHYAMNVVDRVWRQRFSSHPRITGLEEEGHSPTSLHYGIPGDIRCRAFDVDIPDNLTESQLSWVVETLRSRLPRKEWDIIVEGLGTSQQHIHIEHDPKE